jgi:hypothetical protein
LAAAALPFPHPNTAQAIEPVAPQNPSPALSDDCFAELESGKSREIACTFPMLLTRDERADLQRITRQYLQDVNCRLDVRIAREAVDQAISARDHVFQSPEQPVVCTVTTKSSTFDIKATFAPRVVFKNDIAIDASPGLANVTGVSRILSWPVEQYVNRGPGMRSSMLQIVNAYRKYAREKKQQAGAQ